MRRFVTIAGLGVGAAVVVALVCARSPAPPQSFGAVTPGTATARGPVASERSALPPAGRDAGDIARLPVFPGDGDLVLTIVRAGEPIDAAAVRLYPMHLPTAPLLAGEGVTDARGELTLPLPAGLYLGTVRLAGQRSGFWVRRDPGEPLTRHRVELAEVSRLEGLLPAAYEVHVSADDYDSWEAEIVLTAGEVKDLVDVTLTKRRAPRGGIGVGLPEAGPGEPVRVGYAIAGSPAEAAGLTVGDVLLSADGVALDKGIGAAMKVIMGQPGTVVRLSVKRGEKVREVSVRRAE